MQGLTRLQGPRASLYASKVTRSSPRGAAGHCGQPGGVCGSRNNAAVQRHHHHFSGLPSGPSCQSRRVASISRAAGSTAADSGESYDVLGIGQVLTDYAAHLGSDEALSMCDVPKGGRRVITPEERVSVMSYLEDNYETKVSAGGSLANTLVGLSRLGAARSAPKRLRVAMAGCTGGSDALGAFARAQLQQAGVEVLDTGSPVSTSTGTVIVLQTPDAQRSFLSSFPADDALVLTEGLTTAVKQAKLLVLEGYMWELPGSDTVLPALVSLARKVGTLVALTAGDAGVVERHAPKVLAALEAGVDVFFCNAAEAEALLKHLPPGSHALSHQQQQQQQQQQGQEAAAHASSSSPKAAAAAAAAAEGLQEEALTATLSPAQQAALQLAGICPTVVVTDGSKGSYVTAMGELVIIPPFWSALSPVDTTGAGDGYAAGFLYAYLAGADLHSIGHFASRTASAVISRYAPQLTHDDADEVVASHKVASWRLWLQQQAARAMLWQQASPVAAAPAAAVAAAAAPAAVVPVTGAQQLAAVQQQQPDQVSSQQPEQQDAVQALL